MSKPSLCKECLKALGEYTALHHPPQPKEINYAQKAANTTTSASTQSGFRRHGAKQSGGSSISSTSNDANPTCWSSNEAASEDSC